MRLILIGPPGSGKGTQARLLCGRLGLEYIGTGDILREAVQRGTPAGRLAEPYVIAGQLVPDAVVNDLVADRFGRADRPERFVMDGYPRTLAQAASFDQVLRQQFLDLTAAVSLEVQDDEIVRRLCGRLICPVCKTTYHVEHNPPRVPGVCDVDGVSLAQRPDDCETTIRNRLRVYHERTEELIEHYRRQGLMREVPAEGGIEAIYARIVQAVQAPPARS